MTTKLNAAELYRNAIKRSKPSSIPQEPKTFSKGGALMGRMEEEQTDTEVNMSVEDRVRAIYSSQRQMLKETL